MKKIILSFMIGVVSVIGIFLVLNTTNYVTLLPDAILPDSGKYQGEMVKGIFHGQGKIVWSDGSNYEGMFSDGLFHGQGRLQMADGSVYEGEFTRGQITGTGTMVYKDELTTIYTGELKDGLAHGEGILKNADQSYEGQFRRNKYHGQGAQTFESGVEYSGGFENNAYQGQGTYTMDDGQVYRGQFVDGSFTGEGEYTNSDGNHYKGTFKDWLYHGNGELKKENGDRYLGTFEQGVLTGEGEHIAADGTHYTGGFNYGMYQGKGTLTYAKPIDGIKTVSGQFEYNRLVESKDMPNLREPGFNNEIALYNQETLLQTAWSGLQTNDPNEIDLYFLGVAGDGKQAVFRREIQFVQDYFDKTYKTMGKSMSLINDKQTVESIPLATRTSIQRTLSTMANRMDPEQDILFIYLSSHGSSDFELSLDQPGFSLPDLSAKAFAEILNELPMKWKVIVISACYSGGFIPELKNEQTLIIAAAADDKRSFGCDDKNDFTYFGEAYFKTALPQTNDFITAFDKAKEIVNEREKSQDYDNSYPQIFKPNGIARHLEKWQKQESRVSSD